MDSPQDAVTTAQHDECPDSDVRTECPDSDVRTECPDSDVRTECPDSDVRTECPQDAVTTAQHEECPDTDVRTECPDSDVRTECPDSDVRTECPDSDVKTECPDSDVRTECPDSDVRTECPDSDVRTECPDSDVRTECPDSDVRTECPDSDVRTECPDSDVRTECPDSDVRTECPDSDVRTECPDSDVRTECPDSDVRTECPDSDVRTECPDSDVRTECPDSDVRTECPDSDVRTECPDSDVRTECPDSDVRAECPDSDVRTECPDSDVRTECPDSDVRTECPDSDVRTECPQDTVTTTQHEECPDSDVRAECPQDTVTTTQHEECPDSDVRAECPDSDVRAECPQDTVTTTQHEECPDSDVRTECPDSDVRTECSSQTRDMSCESGQSLTHPDACDNKHIPKDEVTEGHSMDDTQMSVKDDTAVSGEWGLLHENSDSSAEKDACAGNKNVTGENVDSDKSTPSYGNQEKKILSETGDTCEADRNGATHKHACLNDENEEHANSEAQLPYEHGPDPDSSFCGNGAEDPGEMTCVSLDDIVVCDQFHAAHDGHGFVGEADAIDTKPNKMDRSCKVVTGDQSPNVEPLIKQKSVTDAETFRDCAESIIDEANTMNNVVDEGKVPTLCEEVSVPVRKQDEVCPDHDTMKENMADSSTNNMDNENTDNPNTGDSGPAEAEADLNAGFYSCDEMEDDSDDDNKPLTEQKASSKHGVDHGAEKHPESSADTDTTAGSHAKSTEGNSTSAVLGNDYDNGDSTINVKTSPLQEAELCTERVEIPNYNLPIAPTSLVENSDMSDIDRAFPESPTTSDDTTFPDSGISDLHSPDDDTQAYTLDTRSPDDVESKLPAASVDHVSSPDSTTSHDPQGREHDVKSHISSDGDVVIQRTAPHEANTPDDEHHESETSTSNKEPDTHSCSDTTTTMSSDNNGNADTETDSRRVLSQETRVTESDVTETEPASSGQGPAVWEPPLSPVWAAGGKGETVDSSELASVPGLLSTETGSSMAKSSTGENNNNNTVTPDPQGKTASSFMEKVGDEENRVTTDGCEKVGDEENRVTTDGCEKVGDEENRVATDGCEKVSYEENRVTTDGCEKVSDEENRVITDRCEKAGDEENRVTTDGCEKVGDEENRVTTDGCVRDTTHTEETTKINDTQTAEADTTSDPADSDMTQTTCKDRVNTDTAETEMADTSGEDTAQTFTTETPQTLATDIPQRIAPETAESLATEKVDSLETAEAEKLNAGNTEMVDNTEPMKTAETDTTGADQPIESTVTTTQETSTNSLTSVCNDVTSGENGITSVDNEVINPDVSHVDDQGDGDKSALRIDIAAENGDVISGVPDVTSPQSKTAMETELQFLRQELRQQTHTVQRLQEALYEQQVRANTTILALRSRLKQACSRHRQLQQQQQQHQTATLSDLLLLEGRMQEEQQHVLLLLQDKDDIIQRQTSTLDDLSIKNEKLTSLLTQVHGYPVDDALFSRKNSDEIEHEGVDGHSVDQISSSRKSSEETERGGVHGHLVDRAVSFKNGSNQMEKGGLRDGRGLLDVTPQVVLRGKTSGGHRVHFGSVKDTLKRHRSSQELHRPRSMETLLDVSHYSSQEYLSDGSITSSSLSPSASFRKRHSSSKGSRGRDVSEDLGVSKSSESSKGNENSKTQEVTRSHETVKDHESSKDVKSSEVQDSSEGHEDSKSHGLYKRREPSKSHKSSKGHHEASKGRESSKGHENSKGEKGKKSRQKDRQEKCASMIEHSTRLLDLPEVSSEGEREREDLSHSLPHHYKKRKHSPQQHMGAQSPQLLGYPQGHENLYSDEDDCPKPDKGDKQYGELAKARSMPLNLVTGRDKLDVEANLKPRPRSLPGEGLTIHVDPVGVQSGVGVSMNPSPTSLAPPEPLAPASVAPVPAAAAAAAAAASVAAPSSESSPFQSLKNVFRRRSTKQRNKKRPVSMGQPPSQEFQSAVKEHFKKYDMS